MKSTTLLASLAILAAAISNPLEARDREHDSQPDRQYVTDKRAKDGFEYGMQEVRHSASPNTPRGRDQSARRLSPQSRQGSVLDRRRTVVRAPSMTIAVTPA